MSIFLGLLFPIATLWLEIFFHNRMGLSILISESTYAFPLFMSYGALLFAALCAGVTVGGKLDE